MKHEKIYENRKAQFYSELKSLIDRSKISYSELSRNLPMYSSKQAFSQALKNQTLKLEALFAIADGLEKRLLIQFLEKNGEDTVHHLYDPESKYETAYQQLARCREQLNTRDQVIKDLRESLRDKQTIIDILQKQLDELKNQK